MTTNENSITEFVKAQYDFLNSKLSSPYGVNITIATGQSNFDASTIESFNNKTRKNFRVDLYERMDRFIKSGLVNDLVFSSKNAGENSIYESASVIYMTHKIIYMEIQFIHEFKGKTLFKEFTISTARISCADKRYTFLEISNGWETGVQNAGLSFKEALFSPLKFVMERKCKEE